MLRICLKSFVLILLVICNIGNLYAQDKIESIKIVSSINPIHQIVKFIASNEDQPSLLINSAISGHDYVLKPSDVKNTNDADLIFYISDDLEFSLSKILKNSNNKDKAIELINLKGLTLLNYKNYDSEFGLGIDNHIWLDINNAIIIAEKIAYSLARLNSSRADFYYSNVEKFIKEIKHADQTIKSILATVRDINYMIYHDAYQYFENHYDFEPSSVISNYHDQQLSVQDIRRIHNIIKDNNVKCIFGQKQEESKIAVKIAKENNINFAVIDIMGDEDYENQNGYLKLMSNLAIDFSNCLMNIS